MLDQAREKGEARLEGFDAFVQEVTRFLGFKSLTVPAGATCVVVLKGPGEQPNLGSSASLWAGINLGDEAISIVYVNLTSEMMRSQLVDVPDVPSRTPGEWAEVFLGRYPDYPPVRLRIEPGEGYLLPSGGLLLDSFSEDVTGPAVSLVIQRNQLNCITPKGLDLIAQGERSETLGEGEPISTGNAVNGFGEGKQTFFGPSGA